MKLFTNCDSCKEEIRIKSNASTRSDLEMEKSEVFTINCSSCGINQKRHVNDIRAKQNNVIVLGGIGISIIVTVALWSVLGVVGTITGAIPVLIWKQQSNAVHTFNTYKVRRTQN